MDLSRRAIILIYGRAFSFFLSLLIPIVLSRLLLKEDYGSYQQLIVIYTIVQAVLLLGMPQSLLYYFPRKEPEEHPLLIRQTWTILLLSSLAVAFLFWVGAEMMKTSLPGNHLQPFIFLLGIYTGIMILVMPIQNLLIVEGNESLAMKSMIGFTLIDILVLPTAAWYNPTTLGIVHGILGTAVLKLIIVLGYVYTKYISNKMVGTPYYMEQITYGIPVGLTAMIYVINVNIDKYMVGLFFSSSVFAAYYLGSLWAPIFGWITQSVAQVVTPRLSKYHKDNNLEEMLNLYRNAIEKLFTLFFPATIFLAIIAEPLIITLFTDNYSDAVPIFTIYLILLPTYAFNLGWILMASRQTTFILRLAAFAAIVNAILSYLLITTLEGDNRLLAIPFATVSVTWISTIVIMNKSVKTIDSKVSQAFPWNHIGKVILISIVCAAPIVGVSLLDLAHVVELIISAVLFGMLFIFLSLKAKVIGDDEIKLVKSFLPF